MGPYHPLPCPPPEGKGVKETAYNGAKDGRCDYKIQTHLLWHDVVAGVRCGGGIIASGGANRLTVKICTTAIIRRLRRRIPVGIVVFPTAVGDFHPCPKVIKRSWIDNTIGRTRGGCICMIGSVCVLGIRNRVNRYRR